MIETSPFEAKIVEAIAESGACVSIDFGINPGRKFVSFQISSPVGIRTLKCLRTDDMFKEGYEYLVKELETLAEFKKKTPRE